MASKAVAACRLMIPLRSRSVCCLPNANRVSHDGQRMKRVAQHVRIPKPSRSHVGKDPLARVLATPTRRKARGKVVGRGDDQLSGARIARRSGKPLEPRDNLGLISSQAAVAPVLAASRPVELVERVPGIPMQLDAETSPWSSEDQVIAVVIRSRRNRKSTLRAWRVLRRNPDRHLPNAMAPPPGCVDRDWLTGAGNPCFVG